jgi:hypothetical protein
MSFLRIHISYSGLCSKFPDAIFLAVMASSVQVELGKVAESVGGLGVGVGVTVGVGVALPASAKVCT